MLTYDEAREKVNSSRSGYPKVMNNTYVRQIGNDYVVKFHATDVITLHPDGTYTLAANGWHTVTTKTRFRELSPANVYSDHGTWYVWHRDDPKTAPKLQKCRKCHGTGKVHEEAWLRYWDYSQSPPVKFDPPEVMRPARDVKCWNCSGTGRADYGSKPRPYPFVDGMRVDSDGKVIDSCGLARRWPSAEELAEAEAREAKLRKTAKSRERREWLRFNDIKPSGGKITVFKCVGPELISNHGTLYPIGGYVTAPDWSPDAYCGRGLHFSPTPGQAATYCYGMAGQRFLACEVDARSFVSLGWDKIKAKSCKILHEVDMHGVRVDSTSNAEVTA